jgi:hypothetical protein
VTAQSAPLPPPSLWPGIRVQGAARRASAGATHLRHARPDPRRDPATRRRLHSHPSTAHPARRGVPRNGSRRPSCGRRKPRLGASLTPGPSTCFAKTLATGSVSIRILNDAIIDQLPPVRLRHRCTAAIKDERLVASNTRGPTPTASSRHSPLVCPLMCLPGSAGVQPSHEHQIVGGGVIAMSAMARAVSGRCERSAPPNHGLDIAMNMRAAILGVAGSKRA